MEKENMNEDGKERECQFWYINENLEPSEGNSLCGSSVKSVDLRWFLNNFRSSENKLSKHITSFDERFLLCCLELIHARASRVASFNFSPDMEVLSDGLESKQVSDIWVSNKTDLVVECSLAEANAENAIMKSTEDWIVGSITGSKSMINILKSPLLNKPIRSLDFKEPTYSDWTSSPGGFSSTSSSLHRKHYSMSTTNSTCSDQSTFVASVISQGMLQITWTNGLPHFVFSMDGKNEVYVADVVKVNSSDEKCFGYLYTFRQKTQPAIVGKMTVSTSFKLSPNKSEFTETLFVMYGFGVDCSDNSSSPDQIHRKNKKLSKKVVDVFRPGHSNKQRKTSKFSERTNAIFEEYSLDVCSKPDLGGINQENHLPTNFELAAIVVRSYLHKKAGNGGGWGLKFLKKPRDGEKVTCLETPIHADGPYHISSVECSTTTNVLIPAGFHGGPVTRDGGPTSLLERWSSGGHCDCGGWDVGCPLTILNTRQNIIDALSQVDVSGDCKTIDLFVQGSRQNAPIMKISNIHDDLFYVHFEPNLSALQSFAIATAIIHSHEPIFRSKMYRR
ncbi:unnamed protein product [Cuscuta epithymum]|uniref:Uncharacterized protein n=1 Tax=Cuscuta epithymum TaxID=186058 RepID=A0AAV0FNX1_9ASTE|nr:unnamed protein product [Cuscuta epithymum]